MAPGSAARRLQRWLRLPYLKVRSLPLPWRLIWRVITALSLIAVTVGAYRMYRDLPQGAVQARPIFLAVALGIYLLTFGMHLMGWHRLSGLVCGDLRFRQNVEAVARSNLVKYLPTIAWYIANRAHYYGRQAIPQGRAVTASFYELGFMIGANAAFLGIVWLFRLDPRAGAAAFAALAGGWLAAIGWVWLRRGARARRSLWRWSSAFLWYALTWPLAGVFLWAIINAYTLAPLALLATILWIWLAASLAGYLLSLSLGFLAIAREITLTVLLAQIWPLPVALACAITVKLLLTVGEVVTSLGLLAWLRLSVERSDDG